MSDRSAAVLESRSAAYLYPAAMAVLVIVTSVALSMDRNWIGLAAFVLLAIMSLVYGAVQLSEGMP